MVLWSVSLFIGAPGQTRTVSLGSLGIPVVRGRILGCEDAFASSHPKIRGPTAATPNEPQPSDSKSVCQCSQFGDPSLGDDYVWDHGREEYREVC
jgi:hypothetical protein